MDTKEDSCFVCNNRDYKTIAAKDAPMRCCNHCGSMWQLDLKHEIAYKEIYDEDYYRKIWGYSQETDHLVARSKWHVSKKFIALLHRYKKGGTVLEIGCGLGYLLSLLQKDSFCYDVYGIELSSFAKNVSEGRVGKGRIFSSFIDVRKKHLKCDALLFFDSLEHIPDQEQLFTDIDLILKKDGVVLVIMPDCGSWISTIMGRYWIEYKKDHVLFYNKKSFALHLEEKGYRLLLCRSTWKTVTIYYLISYLSVFRIPVLSSFFEMVGKILPSFILNIPISLPIGQMVAVFVRK
ncbi:MAG: class I SAM-dependent methyltransferase [Nanoarchaeota archaeon]